MEKNNIRRILNKSALEEALLVLNKEFLNDLPDTPENLFYYAKRRVKPEISNNISKDLGKKMLEYRLSDKEYFITFLKIVRYVFYGKEPSKTPKANILLSQTGAGKSNLRELILRQNPNFVIIDSDKFKRFRYDANDIFEKATGGRVMADPLELVNDFWGDTRGYKVKNFVDLLNFTDPEWSVFEKTEKKEPSKTIVGVLEKIGEQVPFLGSWISEENGRIEGIGRITKLAKTVTLGEYTEFVKKALSLEHVLLFGDEDQMIRTVAVSPGSGRSMTELAVQKGADVIITGDI